MFSGRKKDSRVPGNVLDMMNTMLKVVQDLLSAPASQAFVERLFSLCGLLTADRRHRMDKSLEMRVFLRLNAHMVVSTTENLCVAINYQ
jgi:hypothetical protein